MLYGNGFHCLILAITVGLSSCTTSSPTTSVNKNKDTVVASYSVLCDLTEIIAQKTVNLICLIPPNQDPHTYTPTPSDRQTIEKAKLVLYGGYEFEPKIIELIEASKNDIPKIAVSEVAVKKPLLGKHQHEHEGEKREADPHIWHNVKNAIAMVEIIRKELTSLNSNEASLYENNAKKLTEELQQLDNWIKEQINTIPEEKRTLIATHDALGYYVNEYQLKALEALQGLSEEESPTASRVKELVKIIQQEKVPTIFAEITADNKVIETVAREAKVRVSSQQLIADGLGEKNTATGTYINMMINNTCAIVDGLGGKCDRQL